MNMTKPLIVKGKDAPLHKLHGDGAIKRLIYPATVGSEKLFVGVAEVEPGEAPHVFHTHGKEKIGDIELEYDSEFEEFYYVVTGNGSMQWRTDDGTLHEQAVNAGDAIYMPPGVCEHRIFNSGGTRLTVLYGGTPPARITEVD